MVNSMDNKLNIDINSIDKTKKNMINKCNELIEMFNNYKKIVDDSKKIYDTDSGNLYRTIVEQYTNLIISFINNDFIPYVNSLDEIENIYREAYKAISDSTTVGE